MNTTFRGKVRDISPMGAGVVDHPEGRVFFVKGVWPGDEGTFEIESIEKRFGFARLIQADKYSDDREGNPCHHFGSEKGQCGGCAWLGIKYSAQLEQKQKIVSHFLKRNTPEAEGALKDIWGSSKSVGYRNRTQLKTDGKKIGYVTPGTKQLAPVEDCIILSDPNRQTLADIKKQLPSPAWKPKPPYLWNFIEIDESMNMSQVQLNKKTTFQQANSAQNLRMKNWLAEKLQPLDKAQKVLELFCGSGNFTQVIADQGFENIVASEMDIRAVEKLARTLPAVKGFALNLFEPKRWKPLLEAASDAKILVLDPPREGFKEIGAFVAEFKSLEKIFYISCEPNRFFMEGKKLSEMSWKLKEIQPVDQFPQTPHIEILAEFTR